MNDNNSNVQGTASWLQGGGDLDLLYESQGNDNGALKCLVNNSVDLLKCQDKFILYQYWRSFWILSGGGEGPYGEGLLNFLKSAKISKWSSDAQAALLLSMRTQLVKGESSPNQIATIHDCIRDSFMVFASLPPAYAVCWLLDCLRNLVKRDLESGKDFPIDYDALLRRLDEFPLAYQFKVMNGILRVAKLSISTIEFFHSKLLELIQANVCQQLLMDLVSTSPVQVKVIDSLGIAVYGDRPFAKIFIMRLFIFVLNVIIKEKVQVEFFYSLFKVVVAIPWERWEWTLALMALFNEHEGLLSKMLLLVVTLEDECPDLFLQEHYYFCSLNLYVDLLFRTDYNVDYFERALLENLRFIEYLLKLYGLASEGLLFNMEVLYDLQIDKFHRELLEMMEKLPHLLPLRSKLFRLVESLNDNIYYYSS